MTYKNYNHTKITRLCDHCKQLLRKADLVQSEGKNYHQKCFLRDILGIEAEGVRL